MVSWNCMNVVETEDSISEKSEQVHEFSCSTCLEKSRADGLQDNGIHRGMKQVGLI
jgi:hypothetical protein